jgi:hypothetical protein
MGRPIGPLPVDWQHSMSGPVIDADPVANPMNSRMWEIASFAERDDNDCTVTQAAANFAAPVTPPAVAVVLLQAADLSQDARAQYYRFGIDVHSRYEGLPGLTLTTVRAGSVHLAGAPYTAWRRCVVPPIVPAVVPKPKVLMAIPLTQPAVVTDPPQTPGMVVIANEQWFDQWGLAEQMVAGFDQARDPSVPLAVPLAGANPIPEIGPNPILSASSFGDTKITLLPSVPADPMGTTFDQATSAPLFANTTFLLDPPKLGLPAFGAEHLQARVSFKRVINGSNFGVGTAQTDPASDSTGSFLIEFQPGGRLIPFRVLM